MFHDEVFPRVLRRLSQTTYLNHARWYPTKPMLTPPSALTQVLYSLPSDPRVAASLANANAAITGRGNQCRFGKVMNLSHAFQAIEKQKTMTEVLQTMCKIYGI